MKKIIITALLLSLILVLAACGGGNSDSNNEVDDSTKEIENTSPSETSQTNTFEIIATNFDFDQAEYTVQAGEEVKISLINEEGMHGIEIDGLDIKIDGDAETTFTPTEPGEYTIYCNIPCGQGHNDMVSTLIVQ